MNPLFWLILFIIMLGAELVTMGLTTVWFAGGALAAFFAALLGGHLILQVVLFVAVSLLLLIFTRPLAAKYFNKNTVKTNVESLEGRLARVTETIDNLQARGAVSVDGVIWTARTGIDGITIPEETLVRIVGIQGVKLIVEICEEEKL